MELSSDSRSPIGSITGEPGVSSASSPGTGPGFVVVHPMARG